MKPAKKSKPARRATRPASKSRRGDRRRPDCGRACATCAPTTPPDAAAGAAGVAPFEALAAHFRVSPFAVKVWICAGMPGAPDFSPTVGNLQDLAAALGINRRTAFEWAAQGMPREPDGSYNLVHVRQWRSQRPDPPAAIAGASRRLAGRQATGNLTRALFRVLRVELATRVGDVLEALAASESLPVATMNEPERVLLLNLLQNILTQTFRPLCLDEAEVERLIGDCAHLV